MNSRFLISIGLGTLLLGAAAGCKKEEPPKPEPAAPATTSTAQAQSRSKINMRNPMGPMAKIDPQALKDYRLDACYYGTLSLRQTRDAYLASMGKDEPSEKKLPNFGAGVAPAAPVGASGAPAASGAPKAGAPAASGAPKAGAPATPPATTAKPAAPAASGTAAAGKPGPAPDRRPFDTLTTNIAPRAPHERNARYCPVAAGLKEPAMGEVDTALAAYAPYVVELTKDITAASTYYQREEYKKDSFAKGKELHKKLVDEFAKLEEMQDKLGAAIDAWRKAHPADVAKMEEGEKVAYTSFEDARAVLLAAAAKKVEPAAYTAAVDKLDKSVKALQEYSAKNAQDPWTKIMSAPFEAFVKSAKEAKVSDKGIDAEGFVGVVANFASLVEARQRALSRAQVAKGQTQPGGAAMPGAASPAQQPAPAATAAPQPNPEH